MITLSWLFILDKLSCFDLRPGLQELLLCGFDDNPIGVPHHGDQHVQQEDRDQNLTFNNEEGSRKFFSKLTWKMTKTTFAIFG